LIKLQLPFELFEEAVDGLRSDHKCKSAQRIVENS
jgi:hypothetical protein